MIIAKIPPDNEIWQNDNEICDHFSEIAADRFRYLWYNTVVISSKRFSNGRGRKFKS